MNNKQREIEADIKRQMIALSAQMDALNEWKATGYNSEICTPALHNWQESTDIINESDLIIFISLQCTVCGLKNTKSFSFSNDHMQDDWTDFREGGEEE